MLWVQTLFPQDKQQQQYISTLSSTVIFGTNLLHPFRKDNNNSKNNNKNYYFFFFNV